MARCKAFNEDEVVARAMEVFWDKGFEATSIQDLVDAMGINRGSIYGTFGDKQGLFKAAMRHYMAGSPTGKLVAAAAETADPRRAIEEFIRLQVDNSCAPGGRRGCLLTNTLTEMGSCDGDVARLLGDGLQRIEEALYTLIRRAQESGEISPWREPRALARTLLATVQGIKALAKVNPGRQALSDIAEVTLGNLD